MPKFKGGGKLALALLAVVVVFGASHGFLVKHNYTFTDEREDQVPITQSGTYYASAQAPTVGETSGWFKDNSGHSYGGARAFNGALACTKPQVDYFAGRTYYFHSYGVVTSGSGYACGWSPGSPDACPCPNPNPQGPGEE